MLVILRLKCLIIKLRFDHHVKWVLIVMSSCWLYKVWLQGLVIILRNAIILKGLYMFACIKTQFILWIFTFTFSRRFYPQRLTNEEIEAIKTNKRAKIYYIYVYVCMYVYVYNYSFLIVFVALFLFKLFSKPPFKNLWCLLYETLFDREVNMCCILLL